MNKLAFSTMLLGSLTLATGCIISTDDGEPTARFVVSWSLTEGGAASDCATAGVENVHVLAVAQIDGGRTFEEIFDCAAGSGTTSAIPLGDYSLTLSARDANNGLLGSSAAVAAALDLEDEDTSVAAFTIDLVALGNFGLSWTLVADAGDGCEAAGATTVRAVIRDANDVDTLELFDCTDGSHETGGYAAGTYLVWLEVLDSSDNILAKSLAANATVADGGATVTVDGFSIVMDGGFFTMTWALLDSGDNTLTCTEAGSDGFSLVSTTVGDKGTAFDDVFNCEDGAATTAKLPVGMYTVVASILEVGTDLALGTSMPRDATLAWGNDYQDLGNFDFVFAD